MRDCRDPRCLMYGLQNEDNHEYALAKGVDVLEDAVTAVSAIAGGGAPIALGFGRLGLATTFSRLGLASGGSNVLMLHASGEATGADYAGFGVQNSYYMLDQTVIPMLPVQYKVPMAISIEAANQGTGWLFREASRNAGGN